MHGNGYAFSIPRFLVCLCLCGVMGDVYVCVSGSPVKNLLGFEVFFFVVAAMIDLSTPQTSDFFAVTLCFFQM